MYLCINKIVFTNISFDLSDKFLSRKLSFKMTGALRFLNINIIGQDVVGSATCSSKNAFIQINKTNN